MLQVKDQPLARDRSEKDYLAEAIRLHKMGANVSVVGASKDGKAPLHDWIKWQTERQSHDDLEKLTFSETNRVVWGSAAVLGIGVFHGVNGWRCFDIDDCDTYEPVTEILKALGLLDDYAWVVRSGSGRGWHIWVRCAEEIPAGTLGTEVKGKYTGDPVEPYVFKQVELRWSKHQTVVPPSICKSEFGYQWCNSEPDDPPIEVSVEAVMDAFLAIAKPKKAEKANPRQPIGNKPIAGGSWVQRRAKELIQQIAETKEGSRNDMVNKVSFELAGYIGAERLNAEAWEDIRQAAIDSGLDENEVDKLYHAFEEGMVQPLYEKQGLVTYAPIESSTPYPAVRANTPLAPVEPEFIESCLNNDEVGDARLLAKLFEERIAYDVSNSTWYLWAGHYWQRDETGLIYQLIDNVRWQYVVYARKIYNEIAESIMGEEGDKISTPDRESAEEQKLENEERGKKEKLVKKLFARAAKLNTHARKKNVLAEAATLHEMPTAKGIWTIPVTGGIWDRNPMLLAVKNGVIDLKTSEHRAGKPSDFIRTICPTEWCGLDAEAPRFEQFIGEIFIESELPGFIQRIFGYGITGEVMEHILAILWGEEGRNGKDTLLDTLKGVLGPATASPVSNDVLIDNNKFRGAGSAQSHIVGLQGKRIVWASETAEGDKLNAAQVKLITGGGTISTREMYGKQFEFEPTHTPFLITNHKPHASADDSALWSRVILIPFTQRFVENPDPTKPNERKAVTGLKAKLLEEAPGILAWLVKGCLDWQAEGLNRPECVRMATDKYRIEEDTLQQFIDECCIIDSASKVQAGLLYDAYAVWCKESNLKPMSGVAFGKKIIKLHEKKREMGGNFYIGIGLNSTAKTSRQLIYGN